VDHGGTGSGAHIYRIDADGSDFRLIAGSLGGSFCDFSDPPDPCGDGGPAAFASLGSGSGGTMGIAVAPDGNVYLADEGIYRIRRIAPNGNIYHFAGTGLSGYNPTPAPASETPLSQPEDVAVGPDGSIYICDGQYVRRVDPSGEITTVAGAGSGGSTGDGIPALQAQIACDTIEVGPDGSIYLAFYLWGSEIRKVDPSGIIRTLAGDPAEYCNDVQPSYFDGACGGLGGPSTKALFGEVRFISLTP
jgi:hypothetical protein